jgi:hypothetical protein
MRASHGRRHTLRAAATLAVAVLAWFAPSAAVHAQDLEPDELDFQIRLEPFADSPADEFASGLQIVSDDALIAPADEPGPIIVAPPAEYFARVPATSPAPVAAVDDGDRWLRLTDIFPLFSGDASLAGVPVTSDEQRNRIYTLLVGYDAFRGIPDGSWQNNGIHTGENYGTRLGSFSDWTGVGLQVGGTVGAYDWGGTDYRQQNRSKAQVQAFITYGLFRRAVEGSPWSAGLVQDWMLNNTWSVFGENPTFSQLRAQIAYAISASNEFGVWGAYRVIDDSHQVPGFGVVRWQPHNQINLFWHHKWSRSGADTWVSIGMPEDDRLGQRGSLGDYIANALAVCPLSDRVSVYSSVMYMHQSATEGGAGSLDEAWNFTVGIALYPRANSRTTTVAGHRWAPLLPIANNGSFMVDASDTY